MDTRLKLKARWVFPVDRPPIENGIVEIASGIILDVRAAEPFESATDLGDVAILPGLVNAHAHLEFSLLEQPLEPALPFTSWIRSLVAYRRSTLPPDGDKKQTALATGLNEAAASGTTLIGDIATEGWSRCAFGGEGPRVISFRELIGLRPETVESQLAIAQTSLTNQPSGLSPHAPYSVSPELLARLIELARKHNAPIAMHLAETRAEQEFLSAGTGEFVEMLKSFGAWPDGGLPLDRRPMDILRMLADSPRALIVHGNYLSADEIDFIANRPHMSVVYCPRTHDYFQHQPHPWQRLIDKGAQIALGTDGRGSNPDLSLWNELIFLRERFPNVAPQRLLELGTVAGARALGHEGNCGTLTAGKRADLIVARITNSSAKQEPHETLFTPQSSIFCTMISGHLAVR